MSIPDTAETVFTEFVREVEPRLRQSLIAAFGDEAGREATADSLAWAWEHWPQVQRLGNPGGYLYRLGKNRTTSKLRCRPAFSPVPPSEPNVEDHWVEPGLPAALVHLSEAQRVAVLLIHGFGWTYREVAEHLGVRTSTVQRHAERGMAKLRRDLKVANDG